MKLLLFIIVGLAEFSNNLTNGKTFFSLFVFQKTDKTGCKKALIYRKNSGQRKRNREKVQLYALTVYVESGDDFGHFDLTFT